MSSMRCCNKRDAAQQMQTFLFCKNMAITKTRGCVTETHICICRSVPGWVKPPHPLSSSRAVVEQISGCQSAGSHGHNHCLVTTGNHAGERGRHAYVGKCSR